MSKGRVQVIYGSGRGKSAAALGYAVMEARRGGSVVVIEFLKKKTGVDPDNDILTRLEPEVRVFRFQKSAQDYDDLSEEEQIEEQKNMRNALAYVRKVLQTGECSRVVLDEVLGLADDGIVTEEDLIKLLEMRPDDMDVILTGRVLGERLREYADDIFEIHAEKNR